MFFDELTCIEIVFSRLHLYVTTHIKWHTDINKQLLSEVKL